jgi:hypothetical protein
VHATAGRRGAFYRSDSDTRLVVDNLGDGPGSGS